MRDFNGATKEEDQVGDGKHRGQFYLFCPGRGHRLHLREFFPASNQLPLSTGSDLSFSLGTMFCPSLCLQRKISMLTHLNDIPVCTSLEVRSKAEEGHGDPSPQGDCSFLQAGDAHFQALLPALLLPHFTPLKRFQEGQKGLGNLDCVTCEIKGVILCKMLTGIFWGVCVCVFKLQFYSRNRQHNISESPHNPIFLPR